jgi:D-threo-aldose 1-dehydrogenase
MTKLPTRTLDRRSDGGVTFTELGFGTAPLGNLYRAVPEAEAAATLGAAWDAGARYYDTAPLYGLGLSETRLNPFLRAHPRDEITLSTKVGRLLEVVPPAKRTGIGKFFEVPSRREVYDYSHDGILRSLDASLERLGVDTIDILYVHDLDMQVHGTRAESDRRVAQFMASGYDALVRLRDEGVIRAFGAGLNEWQVCEDLARRGDFDLFLLAGRYTLLEQQALDSFLPLCTERNIGIVLGGPYNSGILATGARPGAFYDYVPAPQPILDRVAHIERVCAAHGVPLATAALQFPLHHPAVVSVIPGGQRPAEVAANAAALATAVPPALWADLKAEGLLRPDAPTDSN